MFPVVSEIFIETGCFKIRISAILPYSYGRVTLAELVERYWIDRLVPGELNLVYVHTALAGPKYTGRSERWVLVLVRVKELSTSWRWAGVSGGCPGRGVIKARMYTFSFGIYSKKYFILRCENF